MRLVHIGGVSVGVFDVNEILLLIDLECPSNSVAA